MSKSNDLKDNQLQRLNRLENAIGSQALSGQEIHSEYGKLVLEELISSAGGDEFKPELIRERIIRGLRT